MFERLRWPRIGVRLLDLLYPPVCSICEEVLSDGRSLCADCDRELPRLVEPFCAHCGEHFEGAIEGAFVCPNCSGLRFSFEFARPAMLLDERTRGLVHRLKYGREIHLAKELGRLAAGAFADERFKVALEGRWPLVPVPLHRSRLESRHFNQALEIATPLSKTLGLPVVEALKRIRKTETQTRLSRSQRLENLRGAFKISRRGAKWREKAGAILVDDVLTTGSTVDACAKALLKAGFKRVFVVAVMRG
jgi:ComF family protein